MSKVIGDRLPDVMMQAFDGDDLDAKIGPAYLVVTVDDDGGPRSCMLSAGEILAVDDRHLRLALWPDTTTGHNLEQGRSVLFCFVAPGIVHYAKGRSRRLSDGGTTGLEHFEIEVETVESDAHPEMPVKGPITYDVEAHDRAGVTAAWSRQLDGLARSG